MMSTMHGQGTVRFSAMFAETALIHGLRWARGFYLAQGMSEWEFGFWCRFLEDGTLLDV